MWLRKASCTNEHRPQTKKPAISTLVGARSLRSSDTFRPMSRAFKNRAGARLAMPRLVDGGMP
jgi:hypothetical protein